MRARTEKLSAVLRVVVVLGLAVALPGALAAQESWAGRLGIDRLRFTALGAQVGRVDPHGIEPATSWSLQADYGEIAPGWRIVFNATYWGSRFRDRYVQAYADSLKNAIEDPTGDARVLLGDITVSDIALGGDARRTWFPSAWVRPYLAGGLVAHIVNADGRLIDGTFVERATDIVAIGIAGAVGADVRVLPHIALEGQARYDFLSLARFSSLRVGASYYFDTPRSRSR